jgi:hypothetical protein
MKGTAGRREREGEGYRRGWGLTCESSQGRAAQGLPRASSQGQQQDLLALSGHSLLSLPHLAWHWSYTQADLKPNPEKLVEV